MTIVPDERNWHEVSKSYALTPEPFSIGLAREIADILSEAGFPAPQSMLEAGAGSGHLSLLLRQAGYQTDLLDFEPLAIEKCRGSFRQAFGDAGEESRFIVGDLTKLTDVVPEKSYDVVWNSGVLEHFSSAALRDAFTQMKTVARQAVFFIVPNSQSLIYLAYRQKMLEHNLWDVGVEFLRDDYESLAAAAGLAVLKSGYCGRDYTRIFLDYTMQDAPAAEYFDVQLTGGQLASQLYLKYYILAPAPSDGAGDGVRETAEDQATLDKTYYLDSLGAANAASVRLSKQLEDLSKQLEALTRERDQARERLAILEQQSRALARLETLAAEKESLVLSLNARVADKNQMIETISAEKESLALSLNARVADKNQMIETISAERESLRQSVVDAEQQRSEHCRQIQALEESLAERMGRYTELAGQIDYLRARIDEKTIQGERLQSALAEAYRLFDRSRQDWTETARTGMGDLQARLEALRERLNDQLAEKSSQVVRLQDALAEVRWALVQLRSDVTYHAQGGLAAVQWQMHEQMNALRERLNEQLAEKSRQLVRLQDALAEVRWLFVQSRSDVTYHAQGSLAAVQRQMHEQMNALRERLNRQLEESAAHVELLQSALADAGRLFDTMTTAAQGTIAALQGRMTEQQHQHEGMDEILNQALTKTRRMTAGLEYYYGLPQYRFAHFLGLLRANLFSGPLGDRFRFIGRLAAKCLGRYPGRIAQENPLLIPLRQSQQLTEWLASLAAQSAAMPNLADGSEPSASAPDQVTLDLPPAPFLDNLAELLRSRPAQPEPPCPAPEPLELDLPPAPELGRLDELLQIPAALPEPPIPAPEPLELELPPVPELGHLDELLQLPAALPEPPVIAPAELVFPPAPHHDQMKALLQRQPGKDNPVPAPEPLRVPAKLPRRPHGKRRVAYMTNQLLDWRDQRPRFGGGERYAISLASLLRELGLEVHFFQPAYTACEATYEGFPVTCLPIGGECYSEFYHEFCARFTKLTADYDHVLHNMPEFSSGATRQDALMICHGIWFDHNNYTNTKFRTTEWYRHLGRAFSNPRQIVSVDTNSINYIRAIWPELAPRMHYIPNFFNIEEFQPDAAQRNPDKLTILFPRRSQINRGSRILEAILNRVPYDVRFCWVGEGDREDTEMIQDLCKRDPRLSFHAAVFSEMAQWYQKADITVIPTIACEGTSLACLEALACGSAVISTNVGGLSDLVQTGTNGLLVDPRAEDIADAINHLIEDEADRLRLEKIGPESARPFELQQWRQRWAAVLARQNWAPEEAFASLGLLPDSAKEKTTSVARRAGLDLAQKRVGIITKNGIHGGVESVIAFQSRLLNASVIVAGGIDNPQTCPFPYTRADDYESLVKALGNFDVVLYHWLPEYAVQAIADFGLPCVEYVHRVDTCDNDKSVPTAIMAHSNFLAEFVTETFDRECQVVELPINTAAYTPQPELGNCIGAVTSYYNIKGLDVFLRAWAMIKDEFPDVPARFYGQGADLESLQTLARELEIEVDFRPAITEPWKVLPEFRCFVLPSRLEGLPMASLEALSMEVPVVASDIDGFVEFNALARLRGLEHGFEIFKMDDPASMAEAMRKVLNNPVRPKTHDYIERHFGLEHHRNNCEAVLKAALQKSDSGPRTMSCQSVWLDEKCVGDPATTLGIYYIKVGEIFETIFPAGIEEMRRTTLTNDYYLCFHIQLPGQFCALEWQVIADREAKLGWQIDWFDADKTYLGYSASSAQVYPGKMRGALEKKVPAGAGFAKVTLRPIPGEAFMIEKLRLRSFI